MLQGGHQGSKADSAAENAGRVRGRKVYLELTPLSERLEAELLGQARPFTVVDVAPGITATRIVSQGEAIGTALGIGIGIAASVPVNLFCSWLYDKLRKAKPVALRIDGRDVEVSPEAIAEAVTNALASRPPGHESGPGLAPVCPACGYEMRREVGYCEVCRLTTFGRESEETRRQAELVPAPAEKSDTDK